jgi:putative PEP-CTERM system TPR-repeat lipoprotein
MKSSALLSALALATAAALVTGCGGESEKTLLASAKTFIDNKDNRAAVIQLKNVLQKNPQSGEARYLLGKALLAGGDPVGAGVELAKAQELGAADDLVAPELGRALLMMGESGKVITQLGNLKLGDGKAAADLSTTLATAHAIQGDADKAQRAVDAAFRAQPGYAPALIVQARLKAAANEIDIALALIDEVLAKEPTNERAGVFRAELLLAGKKDVEGAMAAYRKVLAAHPGSVASHTAVVNVLFAQGKADEAKAQVALMKKEAPNHPDTLYFEAQIAFAEQDFKTTRELTDRILKMLPNNVRALELAGAAEYRLKSYGLAEVFLGNALKINPNLRLSRQMLAQTYLRNGQPHKTIEVLQPLFEKNLGDGVSLALAGEAYLQLGDARRSEAAFQAAAKAAPGDPRVATSVAMAKASQGGVAGGQGLAQLEAIAAEDKTRSRADLAVISARLRQNDLPGALKAIDALQKKMPDAPLAYNLRGRVQLLKRDLPAAAASFEAALSKDPKFFPAIASLAAIELSANKPEAARKRLEDALKADPRSFQAALALAELSARTGAPVPDVTQQIAAAIKLSPSEATPRLLLVNYLLGAGDNKAALSAAQDATAALPTNLDVMDALGRAQMASGDAKQALATLRKLSAAQPNNAMHLVRLADASVLNKDTAEAQRSLKKALEIKPDLVAAKRGLVLLAMVDKRPQDAITLARELQKSLPREGIGFSLEGDVEAQRGNWDAAIAAFRAGLQRGASTELTIKLHVALVNGGKRPEADRLAADWQKANPKDAAFIYYLGDSALQRKEMAEAEAYYRQVIELQPRNALAYNNVAWLMATAGKPGAVAMAEKADALLPERAPLLDTLATALAADNQMKKAVEVQRRAMARNPDDPGLRLNLAKHLLKAGEKDQARFELEALQKLGDKFRGQAEVTTLLKSV